MGSVTIALTTSSATSKITPATSHTTAGTYSTTSTQTTAASSTTRAPTTTDCFEVKVLFSITGADLSLTDLKRIFETVFVTVSGASCGTPTFEYQQLANSSRRALAERVQVSVTLGYQQMSQIRVREKQFPTWLGNRLKKKSDAFNEVQVTDVQVQQVVHLSVAATEPALPGLFQFGGLHTVGNDY